MFDTSCYRGGIIDVKLLHLGDGYVRTNPGGVRQHAASNHRVQRAMAINGH